MKKELSTTNTTHGFSLVEVILSSALLGLFVTAFIGAYLYGEESTMLAGNRVQATFLAQEGLEAVRTIRDHAFTDLTDGTHGISINPIWHVSGSSDVTGIFTREITISSIDEHRKNISARVTWQQNPQRSGMITLTTELTDWTAVAEPPPDEPPPLP